MFTNIKNLKVIFIAIVFGILILVGGFLRFYKIHEAPPSISWDEAAVGYNAWTILNWGKDEWGNTLPLVFKSFEDYKHPVHVYLTVPSVAIFGLTELGVRGSAAFFGILNIIVIFFLAKTITGRNVTGLFAAFFLSISPYAIQFSRFNHELNFAIFFFMLGVLFIYKGLARKHYLIPLGYASFGVDLLTYHSAKVVVPVMVLLMTVFLFRDLWKLRKHFFLGVFIFGLFASLLVVEPQLLGLARIKQNSSEESLKLETVIDSYKKHFEKEYLFVRGDTNPRHSVQTGMFYDIDAVFIWLGVGALIWQFTHKSPYRSWGRKKAVLLFAWIILAPFPAVISKEVPHAARAMYMVGSMHILMAVGASSLVPQTRQRVLSVAVLVFVFLLVGLQVPKYLKQYYEVYAKEHAIEWQYGMKQVAKYVERNPQYAKVYMTNVRQQPYIFFLFYLKIPLPELLKSVQYDTSRDKSFNTVASFGKFQFGNWDTVQSAPIPDVLYVVQPADYTGLLNRMIFDVPILIRYPNGSDAFFAVTAL